MNFRTGVKFLSVLIVGPLLASCATLSRDECVKGDWGQYGYDDGAAGYPASRIADHHQACAEYKIAPDQQAYAAGRARGLLSYCTPQGGWRAGREPGSYQNVCAGPEEQQFLNAYRLSSEITRARSDATNARTQANLARMNVNGKGAQATPTDWSNLNNADAKARDMNRRADDIAGRNKQSFIQLFGAVPE